ncbi:hypothetical protein [Streptomyces sp. ODS28]|uniref:hypothetical protein n=1 Tax=Streptomyces sp. ODS28 TaxID=3136688 RepID=UPI0031E7CED8
MQSATAFFAASLDAHGGGRASGALTRYLADDTVAWLRRASTPAERTALLVEASRLALLLARMDADGREHACAQDHFALAERLAEESGEAAAQAVVLRMLSTHAGRLGRHRQALRTAETATRTVPDSAGPERAFVLAQLAVARASCAERRGALRALSAAEHTVESAEEGEGPFGSYPRAALDFQTGEVLHALGDETAALRAWQRSLDARAYADRRGRALTHGRIAAVLLNAGRAEEATAHLHKARPLLSGLDSLTAHHMIRDLQHRTRTYRRRTRNGPTGNGT